MAIAKSTQTDKPVEIKSNVIADNISVVKVPIPIDIYQYFNVEPELLNERQNNKIKDIFEWAKHDTRDLGDVYKKLSDLETMLGSPRQDEKRYDKMWLWVEMTKKLTSIEKQRNSLRII